MQMTPEQFRAATGLSEPQCERWFPRLCEAMQAYDITGAARMAAFLAQTGHESLGYQFTHELWGPTPAQALYEPPSRKAMALGNVRAGDGKRFRGRGLIQITGRANYAACGAALGADLTATPELLEQDAWAARSAAWWWRTHGCNALADSGDFIALTRRINGGTNGLEDRLRRWKVATAALA
ncbi:putative chitinase [Cupriavidus alkaliphilus]|uniref:Putative chitinase n=3 Tax=Burkholderiaceae TaxID=119060 RepID=A0A1C3U2V8_9BURK|nr:putative chitinase [Cupriavidus alkaliphilus]RAS10350.1 putative chitinase [Cupriavidus alkaliphilus]SCB09777.1 putative chitinase [Cupriavidus alkaliphilus]SPR97763.1 putative chitinase [Cupriavidus taiwanensis]